MSIYKSEISKRFAALLNELNMLPPEAYEQTPTGLKLKAKWTRHVDKTVDDMVRALDREYAAERANLARGAAIVRAAGLNREDYTQRRHVASLVVR